MPRRAMSIDPSHEKQPVHLENSEKSHVNSRKLCVGCVAEESVSKLHQG